jgi:hypothetical protein
MSEKSPEERVREWYDGYLDKQVEEVEKAFISHCSKRGYVDGDDDRNFLWWTPDDQAFLKPFTIEGKDVQRKTVFVVNGFTVHMIHRVVCDESSDYTWPGGYAQADEEGEEEEDVEGEGDVGCVKEGERLEPEWLYVRGPEYLDSIQIPHGHSSVRVRRDKYFSTNFYSDRDQDFQFSYETEILIHAEGDVTNIFRALGIDDSTLRKIHEHEARRELKRVFQSMFSRGIPLDETVLDELRLFKISQVQEN